MCVAKRYQSEKIANCRDPVLQVLEKANYEGCFQVHVRRG